MVPMPAYLFPPKYQELTDGVVEDCPCGWAVMPHRYGHSLPIVWGIICDTLEEKDDT